MLRVAIRLAAVVGAVLLLAVSGQAGPTDSQGVTITVAAINEILAGTDVTLTISSAIAGQAPDPATVASTLAWTTNSNTSKKITAALDSALPAGVTLTVNVSADVGEGTSAGDVSLGATAQDVVTAITGTASGDNTVAFSGTASVAVAPQTINRTVTWTLQDQV